MTHRGTTRSTALLAIAATLVALAAFNALVAFALPYARVDLTQEKLYTLSPGAREVLDGLDEPVRLDFYWTRQTGREAPQIQAHALRVREFLDELAALSKGRLVLRVIDPEPFSEAEDEARAAGLPALTVDGSGRTLTLGLVVRGPTDQREVVPYFAPDQEPLLEYEVLKRIATVGAARKPIVGVVAGMPLNGVMDPATGAPMRGPPAVLEELRARFQLEMIEPDAPALPATMDALVVVQPRKLGDGVLRGLDAWAVAGKPLLVLADPYAETDTSPDAREMGAKRGGTTFDLGPLLAAWGVEIVPDMVVGDRTFATRVKTQAPGGGVRELSYPVWLTLTREGLVDDELLVGGIDQLNLMSAGAIRPAAGATSKLEPLVVSTTESQLIQTLKLGFFGDPEQLIRDFASDGAAKVLAARIAGPIRSAFGPATGQASIVLVADADLISDDTWLVEDRSSGVPMRRPISGNGRFIVGAIELLAGDPALAKLRSRGTSRRPFEVVDELRRTAEQKSITRERDLQTEIRRTELRIGELQRERAPDGSQTLLLTSAQAEELSRLQAQMADARKELRQLQHALRASVESLGRSLLAANAILWPLVVAAIAFVWYAVRAAGSRRESGT